MKNLFLIFIIIAVQPIKGQNYFNDLKHFVEKIEKTDSINEKIKNNDYNDLDILEVYTVLNRKIDFDYNQHRLEILHTSGWHLQLDFISKNGEIELGWISQYDITNDKYLRTEPFRLNEETVLNYIDRHNEFYGTNYTTNDFKKQLLGRYVVGFGCGFSGDEISEEAKRSLRWSKNRRIKKLEGYLKSINPELQTLGAIGILKIGKVNEQNQKIIDHLKERNSIVYSCSGCLYGVETTFKESIE